MYFDLNVPVTQSSGQQGKKGKGKQAENVFSPVEIQEVESRVDILVHLGYTVIAFAQTIHKRVEKAHVNILDTLLSMLRKRPGVLYLKRLNILLDEESEKGFGLINANIPLLNTYDLLALIPTTHATFSLACLTHSQPSPLTAHIIALPLTLPRLPFHLKHTLVRTAIKNGAVFEINYVGAIGGEPDPLLTNANAAEVGASAKRNWWAASRELIRVSKGKGLLLSGGVASTSDLRAPRDVGNLVALLSLPQDAAHAMSTSIPKSIVLRAQTRKTYRAVLSEPRLCIPNSKDSQSESKGNLEQAVLPPEAPAAGSQVEVDKPQLSKKRSRDELSIASERQEQGNTSKDQSISRKKKRKKNFERKPDLMTK